MRLIDRSMLAVLLPIVKLIQRIESSFEDRLRAVSRRDQSAAKALKALRVATSEEGNLEEDERKMIDHIYELSETLAREVMVPRVDMVCSDVTNGLDEVVRLIQEHGHTRIPVYKESVDYIEGIVYAKDVLISQSGDETKRSVLDLAREPYFIPETKKIDELLRHLRRKKVHMAIVVDEYGGTAGLVTLEDILEEIVGEIQDEYDEEEPEYEKLGPDHFRVDGKINLDDLNELMETDLPTDSVDTVGGFIYDLLGRIPHEGEAVEWNDLHFVVEQVEGQRIAKVIVTRVAPQ